jgi:predicted porin
MLNKKFTFFLLADLYIRRIKLKNTPEDTNPILYSPTKNENQLYLKTAYSISRNTSLYFKTGYFSENLFLNNFNVEGINIFLGFEYKN